MNHDIDLGHKIGLIGDVHANRAFLEEAIVELAARGVTSIVQLGDFGMIWDGGAGELWELGLIDELLQLEGLDLYVVLGNHENYDAIAVLEPDAAGIRRVGEHGRVKILPRAGTAIATTAEGTVRPIGWLSGAGSVDRNHRSPGQSWWEAEIPTEDEARALESAGLLDVIFAHDALDTASLQRLLLRTAHQWEPASHAYAESTRKQFSDRVTRVLADRGVVLSGHYHFFHSTSEVMTRPDGTEFLARSEILSAEWDRGSVGILDVATLDVEPFTLFREDITVRTRGFVEALKAHPELAERVRDEYGFSATSLQRMRSGHQAVPLNVLEQVGQWMHHDAVG